MQPPPGPVEAAAHAAGHATGQEPTLTIALALIVGIMAQSLARHLRVPGIVLLLAAGVLLGPDMANLIQPESLQGAMSGLVGFAVAVILFEGGMNLQFRRLLEAQHVIRALVTVGPFITAAAAAVAARYIMNVEWRAAFLFGTLVIVTGPTVITPLLRRIKVKRSVQTVLEAEGILIDAVGALLAVLALEIAIQPSAAALTGGLVGFLKRIALGVVAGSVGGLLIAWALRFRRVVPDGLENVFTLSAVLALAAFTDSVLHESAIVTVVVAGMIVGNVRTRVLRDLMEFKEQLTMMFIGMLFVLLAADVRVADVKALGVPGLWTVAALIFLVRPFEVLVCTLRSGLKPNERAFIGWMAPRGIVAAAVASLFADSLDRAGIEGGRELRAMVFLVIGITVAVAGLTGGLAARILRVRRGANQGYLMLGANPLSRALGRSLVEGGEEVVIVDSNADHTRAAQEDGLKVIYGNGLEERTLLRAETDRRVGAIALTANEEVNLLFARRAREFKLASIYVALEKDQESVTEDLVDQAGAAVLFGTRCDVELWSVRMRRDQADVERWRLGRKAEETDVRDVPGIMAETDEFLIPLVMVRRNRARPLDGTSRFDRGDDAFFAVYRERRDEAAVWLRLQGWVPVDVAEPEDAPA